MSAARHNPNMTNSSLLSVVSMILLGCGGSEALDSSSSGDVEPLTALEESMLGTWIRSASNETEYYIFEEGRVGCRFTRLGDNFTSRAYEVKISDWGLDEENPEADENSALIPDGSTLIPLSYQAVGGSRFDFDRYVIEADMFVIHYVPDRIARRVSIFSWSSARIACNDNRIRSTGSNKRRGTKAQD